MPPAGGLRRSALGFDRSLRELSQARRRAPRRDPATRVSISPRRRNGPAPAPHRRGPYSFRCTDRVRAPMSWEPELEELRRREALARNMGGEERVARQHASGRMTVRERIEKLV